MLSALCSQVLASEFTALSRVYLESVQGLQRSLWRLVTGEESCLQGLVRVEHFRGVLARRTAFSGGIGETRQASVEV